MPRLIPDPRPSRAHPVQRKVRKELEKEHGYEWIQPILLGMLGLTLAYDVEKDVEKHEARHRKEEAEAAERKRRRREREARYGSPWYRRRGSYDEDEHRRRRDDDDNDGNDDEEEDHDADGYDDREGGKGKGRACHRVHTRDEDQKQWIVTGDDVYVDDKDEVVGGGPEVGLERAETLERGEAFEGKLDGGLDRADQLEKGEGGMDERKRYGARPRRSIAYDAFGEGRRHRRRRRDEDDGLGYEYVDERRGRRDLDEGRSRRPRTRRRSSDW